MTVFNYYFTSYLEEGVRCWIDNRQINSLFSGEWNKCFQIWIGKIVDTSGRIL